jgi:hypothetical protein
MIRYAKRGYYVRDDRESHPYDHVYYVGPYPDMRAAITARDCMRAGRPCRPGPNGPIDFVDAVLCAPRADLVTAAIER